ncbi:Multi antimicrobial extrusion protein [Corchorus olitorius]|uniref:Multi antimicrobial extrusion protein n=1 Tax=Corchorus olitorius TaxID=93759 RepID=A0A1R3HL99_9ROSI|nr:Multi antimicrobial extrusion protein [Corchorus olitorius]
MSSATETLCGQAFGAGHHHMMGVYLQRSWIVDGITATMLVPFFIFATPIFRILGQEEELAAAAGSISIWFVPMIYNFVLSMPISMFLQAQLKNLIVGWLSTAPFVFHVLLSWIFVNKFKWGVTGAMAAMNISGWAMVLGQLVYVIGGWCPNTWKGFTKAAFYDLLPVVKLSISSGIMICLELWYNSILVLMAGYMKNVTIAIDAFSICLNINGWEFMVCLGFLVAARYNICIATGAGLQSMVAYVNLGSYYAIGIPIGILLGYVAHLQGLWIGLLSGVAVQSLILAFLVWKTDWDEQVRKASERLNRWLVPEEDNQSPVHA